MLLLYLHMAKYIFRILNMNAILEAVHVMLRLLNTVAQSWDYASEIIKSQNRVSFDYSYSG